MENTRRPPAPKTAIRPARPAVFSLLGSLFSAAFAGGNPKAVFRWFVRILGKEGLLEGQTIVLDATTARDHTRLVVCREPHGLRL
jgi:hypothetical protein